MRPKEEISKYEFGDYLKKRSPELFGRETPLSEKRKLEQDFKNEIFGPLPSVPKKNLDSVILGLERNKWKTTDKIEKSFIQNKIDFLKHFVKS